MAVPKKVLFVSSFFYFNNTAQQLSDITIYEINLVFIYYKFSGYNPTCSLYNSSCLSVSPELVLIQPNAEKKEQLLEENMWE